jgi:hypothetical protein
MPPTTVKRDRVGALRPSQLMYSYGVGALVDLPQISVIVGGLSDWDDTNQREIVEERLLSAVRLQLGHQVKQLKTAPWTEETRDPTDNWARVGIPVLPFPRWLRCSNPACRLLAPIESKLFKLRVNVYRPEHTHYEHEGCGKGGRGSEAVSARFVIACEDGHLDDFPWVEFCHEGGTCKRPILRFEDIGLGIGGAEAFVSCDTCKAKRHLALAFGDKSHEVLPRCRGRHPHLRAFDAQGCKLTASAMILGASNQWFPLNRSVLSIPPSKDPVEQVVADLWPTLSDCTVRDELDFLLKMAAKRNDKELLRLVAYPAADVWSAIERRRSGAGGGGATSPGDLLSPEWQAFANPGAAPEGPEFRVRAEAPPDRYMGLIERVVLAERLREVTALCGFTRVEGPDWDPGAPPPATGAPMTAGKPVWVPAAESRGEGLFLQIRESVVAAWEQRVEGSPRMRALEAAHERWRRRRGLPAHDGWRGARFVLLHTLAHTLINELALECGYSAASIRERIYSQVDEGNGATMAGILLYTAAPDSEGTLGGLVRLGAPAVLERLLDQALGRARLCASDPLCAEHTPDEAEDALHNAACHACGFVPETSCQAGNRYLDRATLVATMAGAGIEFFAEN